MSEHDGPGPETDSTPVPGTVCPHLGWYVDDETHHGYPSMANHCHSQEPPLTIELAYQASTCLEGQAWATCPRYKTIVSDGVVQKPAAAPWVARVTERRPPSWVFAAIGVALLAAILALFFALRPAVSAPSPSTPTSALSLAQLTATAESSLAAAQSPTPTPTSSPLPTFTPEPLPTSTPEPSPTPSPSPTPPPSATATIQPSPTPTQVDLTPTRALTATATSTPTATPSPTPTLTATQTPTRRPSPTPAPARPSPTPTIGVHLPAPQLVAPAEGQAFTSKDQVTLRWEPGGQLAPTEYYVPTVAYLHLGDTWYDDAPWTKEAFWDLSEHRYLLDLSDNGEFRWAVRVMHRTGINSEGNPEGVAVSPLSEVWTLIWKPAGPGGVSTPEAPPPEGLSHR